MACVMEEGCKESLPPSPLLGSEHFESICPTNSLI